MKEPYQLCLGTAMWAWTISKKMAFDLLDQWYQAGERCIDTATNYPINKNSADFRKAEQWLKEWIDSTGVSDLKIMVKIGALSNDGSSINNLRPSFLSINHQHYSDLFGEQFDCMMIHWDNREDSAAIDESVQCMESLCSSNQALGFSGIKHPTAYLPSIKSLRKKPYLQAKQNALQSHLDYYNELIPFAKTIAYGLSGGGIKLHSDYSNSSSVNQRGLDLDPFKNRIGHLRVSVNTFNQNNPDTPIENMHQLGMTLAQLDPRIYGILIGPSKPEHLEDTLSFSKRLQTHLSNYEPLKKQLDG